MKNTIIAFTYLSIAYVLVWIQLFGSIKLTWIKENNWWFMYVMSLPIAYFMTEGTHIAFEELRNSAWAVRFTSFSINICIFTVLSYAINNEGINLKTTICLILCFVILSIQIFWK